jgi:hypothetical protein
VPISGHVTDGVHREFVMASGEMNASEFWAFSAAWIGASLPYWDKGELIDKPQFWLVSAEGGDAPLALAIVPVLMPGISHDNAPCLS